MIPGTTHDIELRFLENLFEHEAKCERPHRFTTCSVKVVAKVSASCNGSSFLKCANGTAYSLNVMETGQYCGDCNSLARECWTITPI